MVRSYREDILKDMLSESSSAPQIAAVAGSVQQQDERGRREEDSSSIVERAASNREARREEQRIKDEAFRRKIERKREEDAALKEAEFQAAYADVLEGLGNETGIMGDTRYSLEHSARIRATKKKGLYEEWNKEVFDKIQGRLQPQVEGLSPRTLEARLLGQMTSFLAASNTKVNGGLFLDSMDRTDYDPFSGKTQALRVHTGDIRDPLKRDVLNPLREKQLMATLSGAEGAAASEFYYGGDGGSLGKQTLDARSWGELAIASTPYGHCMDKTGNYIIRPTSARVNEARKSKVHMDHYGYPNKDNAVVEQELGRLGKGMAPPPGAAGRAVSRGLTDIMQQTARSAPSSPAVNKGSSGDRWLDAKGKAKIPGPEVVRGRKGLGETLQQNGPNPYLGGPEAAAGDLWLEAKGKGHPIGPEMKRGRPNLNETLQQLSNPYKDGRTLGDSWLETKGKRPLPGCEATIGPVISGTRGLPDPPPAPRGVGGAARHVAHLVNDLTLTTLQGSNGQEGGRR